MGWVFQGNPRMFDIDDYLSRYPELIYWRTPKYGGDIAVGDRAFVWRSGHESGAVALGTVVEATKPANRVDHPEALGDDLWLASVSVPDELKTGIRIEELRLTIAQNMVTRPNAITDPLLARTALIRAPQGTVFSLSQDETMALERLWGLGSLLAPVDPIQEGDRTLRAHFMRERSSRLREDKLKDFRKAHGHLRCEICSETEAHRYPGRYGSRVFEVHHRAPLAEAATPVRTTLADLAVLCANCHRCVHATRNVDENYSLLAAHFM